MPNNLFTTTSISASGMAAERMRMELVANNIANAQSAVSANGEPYRRRHLVFGTAYRDSDPGMPRIHSLQPGDLAGVKVLGVGTDTSDFRKEYLPGHPQADADGMVLMPNVSLPTEMVDLISASRSYEANLRALTLYREMVQQTLSLLSGGRS